eukprot:scaffold2075_cov101-Isochrysis_galbana.AAC.2
MGPAHHKSGGSGSLREAVIDVGSLRQASILILVASWGGWRAGAEGNKHNPLQGHTTAPHRHRRHPHLITQTTSNQFTKPARAPRASRAPQAACAGAARVRRWPPAPARRGRSIPATQPPPQTRATPPRHPLRTCTPYRVSLLPPHPHPAAPMRDRPPRPSPWLTPPRYWREQSATLGGARPLRHKGEHSLGGGDKLCRRAGHGTHRLGTPAAMRPQDGSFAEHVLGRTPVRLGHIPGPVLVPTGHVPGHVPGSFLVLTGHVPGSILVLPGHVRGPILVLPGHVPGPIPVPAPASRVLVHHMRQPSVYK